MAKRFRKKGRRRFSRKKRFRKRMRKFKKTTYDGVYYAKCHFRVPLVVDNVLVSGAASHGIHWGSTGVSGAHDTYINNNQEFISLTGRFTQWKLHGIKLKIAPLIEATGATGSAIFDIQIASDPTVGLAPTTITDTTLQ